MTTAVLNTKIEEVKNKIPSVSDLVEKTDYNAKKISDVETKYFTTSDYRFRSDILKMKIKGKRLVEKSNFSNLVKISNLNTKLASLTAKQN